MKMNKVRDRLTLEVRFEQCSSLAKADGQMEYI